VVTAGSFVRMLKEAVENHPILKNFSLVFRYIKIKEKEFLEGFRNV
jgi:hypothetical protein